MKTYIIKMEDGDVKVKANHISFNEYGCLNFYEKEKDKLPVACFKKFDFFIEG